jgi:DNA-binding NarL/FixJ family response regulator
MDLRLPSNYGTEALISIRGEFPHARIIMLTTSDSDGEIQRAMRAGASAYILKSMPKDELLAIIRSVHSDRRHVPPEVAARLAEHLGEEDLTKRELEALQLIATAIAISKLPIRWRSRRNRHAKTLRAGSG